MATTRSATTIWHDPSMKVPGASNSTRQVSAASMSPGVAGEDPAGRTSPEELIGAAHSSCFSMALSNALAKAGTPPETIETRAEVTFQPGEGITGIHLTVRGEVPGMTPEEFADAAEARSRLSGEPSACRHHHHAHRDARLTKCGCSTG